MPKLFIFCLLIISSLVTEAQSNYERIIQFPNNYYIPINVVKASDGGVIINGSSQVASPIQQRKNHIIKFDKFENILWSKTYGSSAEVFPFGLYSTELGDIYSVGYTEIDTLGFLRSSGFIQKTDSIGNLQWSKLIGGAGNNDALYDLEFINKDTLIAIGHTNSAGNGAQDILCVALKSNGDTIWSKLFGGANHDFGFNISKTIDGNLIIVGFTISIGQGASDILLIKMDYSGNIIWNKSYGTAANETGLDVIQDNWGNFYVLASSSQFPNGMKLIKTDSFGNFIWGKSYSPSTGYFSVDENHNIHFDLYGNIIINAFKSPNTGVICEVDTSGNFVWGKYYTTGGNGFRDTYVLDDNSLLSCSNKPINSVSGLYMVHLDSLNSCSGSIFNVTTDNLTLNIDSGINVKSGILYNDFLLTENTISYNDSIICGTLCNLSFSLGSDITICADSMVNIIGPGGYNYLWSTGDTSQSIYVNGSLGDTTLFLQISNGSCFATDSINIISTTLPIIDIVGFSNYCEGDTVHLYATGAASYNWSNLFNTDSIQYVSTVGSEWVSVVGSLNGCSSSDSINIISTALPTIDIVGSSNYCEGDTVHLYATGAASYNWSNLFNTDSIQYVSPVGSEWVSVVGSLNGCSALDSILIKTNSLPIINTDSNTFVCKGNCVQLNSIGAVTYFWSPVSGLSDSTIYNPIACPEVTTNYTVTGMDANGCVNTSYTIVTVNNLPSFSLNINTTINLGENVLINTGASCDSIFWSPSNFLNCINCSSQTISPINDIEYTIKCIDSFGCFSSGIVRIKVISAIPKDTLDIPNGFTPNNDGTNDVWFILGLDNYPDNEVIIFNRWGIQVYQANPYLNNWDGKYNNSELPAGTYYFLLKLDNTEPIIKGSVNIIK